MFDPSKIQVYINCSGKSGSKTLEKSLNSYYQCLHTHGNFYFQKHVIKNDSITLYDAIRESMKHFKHVFVIDSYRTPIERAISSSFQNNAKTTTENFNYNLMIGENYDCLDETLFNFNIEDVKSFDFNKKCLHLRHENLHIIKVRLSDINEWGSILSDIFKVKIDIIPDNVSKNKKYYDNYVTFLNDFKIPKNLFDYLIETKNFKMYNTAEEQEQYIEKWRDRVLNDVEYKVKDLPDDFDWEKYIAINGGQMSNMCELEASIHYVQTGRFEGKRYKDEEVENLIIDE